MSKMRAMVILSGCGHKDGTEVNEAVLSLMVLEKHGISWTGFAPDEPVVALSHSKETRVKVGERSPLEEASRITRGNILGLSQIEPDAFDLLVMPGGLGAANVLSDFGSKGFHGEVREELKKAIVSFHHNKKPIVAICISPAIVALALKGENKLTITLGEDLTYQKENPSIQFKSARCDQCVVDPVNKIVSTPAFMIQGANRYSIFVGIDQAIQEAMKLR